MFCKNCGAKIEDGVTACTNCGTAVTNQPDTAPTQTKSAANGKTLTYVSVALALISAVLPFLKWVEIPMLNNLSAFFGGGGNEASFSLFGYIFSSGNYSTDASVTVVMLVFAIIAFISVIFNVIYAVKALTKKAKATKWGTMGGILLFIMSVLFLIVIGLMSSILKVISMTATVYISAVISLVNIILLRTIKKSAK